MKAFLAAAAVSLGVLGVVGPVAAQPRPDYDDYGYRDRGYRDRDRGDYESRDRGYRDRDDYRGRANYGFDEREYLRCNPDVRRAIANGQMESGAAHYRVFGRREGRRLSC
ncbi:hypothetical protein GOFOIKOB_3861 [Methylobacterium tardum]|uniref:Lectin-like protein BA14k n=1 Tax=Methylobacterium tardum TaxID=374432 RepID=A0AA37WTX1_9HYPH|nr:hypothetical protein [Methylobacterium tardum]GJE50808.1 hypothetical protein GOFOIKOB_3861 [Methylobacterium tardum]GLS70363.1 hypothetical protein GCM10007890_23760 [Methylobacterium tardum]